MTQSQHVSSVYLSVNRPVNSKRRCLQGPVRFNMVTPSPDLEFPGYILGTVATGVSCPISGLEKAQYFEGGTRADHVGFQQVIRVNRCKHLEGKTRTRPFALGRLNFFFFFLVIYYEHPPDGYRVLPSEIETVSSTWLSLLLQRLCSSPFFSFPENSCKNGKLASFRGLPNSSSDIPSVGSTAQKKDIVSSCTSLPVREGGWNAPTINHRI